MKKQFRKVVALGLAALVAASPLATYAINQNGTEPKKDDKATTGTTTLHSSLKALEARVIADSKQEASKQEEAKVLAADAAKELDKKMDQYSGSFDEAAKDGNNTHKLYTYMIYLIQKALENPSKDDRNKAIDGLWIKFVDYQNKAEELDKRDFENEYETSKYSVPKIFKPALTKDRAVMSKETNSKGVPFYGDVKVSPIVYRVYPRTSQTDMLVTDAIEGHNNSIKVGYLHGSNYYNCGGDSDDTCHNKTGAINRFYSLVGSDSKKPVVDLGGKQRDINTFPYLLTLYIAGIEKGSTLEDKLVLQQSTDSFITNLKVLDDDPVRKNKVRAMYNMVLVNTAHLVHQYDNLRLDAVDKISKKDLDCSIADDKSKDDCLKKFQITANYILGYSSSYIDNDGTTVDSGGETIDEKHKKDIAKWINDGIKNNKVAFAIPVRVKGKGVDKQLVKTVESKLRIVRLSDYDKLPSGLADNSIFVRVSDKDNASSYSYSMTDMALGKDSKDRYRNSPSATRKNSIPKVAVPYFKVELDPSQLKDERVGLYDRVKDNNTGEERDGFLVVPGSLIKNDPISEQELSMLSFSTEIIDNQSENAPQEAIENLLKNHEIIKNIAIAMNLEEKEILTFKSKTGIVVPIKFNLHNHPDKMANMIKGFNFMEEAAKNIKTGNELSLGNSDTNKDISTTQNEMDMVTPSNAVDGKIDLMPSIIKGMALSSLLKPLNDYAYANPYIEAVMDDPDNRFKRLHTTAGKLVKHLMISREANAVTKFRTHKTMASLKVATLRDLIENTDREKLLTASEAYYNASTIETMSATFMKGEKERKAVLEQRKADDAQQKAEIDANSNSAAEATAKKVLNDVKDTFVAAVQDAARASNDPTVMVSEYNSWKKSDFIISQSTLKVASIGVLLFDEQLANEQYNAISSLNGIRQAQRILNSKTLTQAMVGDVKYPIFMSSKSTNKDTAHPTNYLNYILLKNIAENLSSNYRHILDLDAPLYVDVYGNVVTESGLVVIPFAANGTNKKRYNFLTVAWSLNVPEFELPEHWKLTDISYNNIGEWEELLSESTPEIVSCEQEEGFLKKQKCKMAPVQVIGDTTSLIINEIDLSDVKANRILYNLNKSQIEKAETVDVTKYTKNIMYPVSKGSYPELIDFEAEEISTLSMIDILGLKQALKMESFIESTGKMVQNTLMSVPDIRFYKGFAYMMYTIMRIMMIIVTLLSLLEIYFFAVRSKFSITFFYHLAMSLGVIMSLLIIFPILYNQSYRYSKVMMQPSLMKIAALNQERMKSEMEIGIIEGKDPTASDSKLLLKLGEDNINWTKLMLSFMDDSSILTTDKLFKEATQDTRFIEAEEFEKYGNLNFIDIQKLFESSIIATDTKTGVMKQYVKDGSKQSYYIPYYVFVDYIIRNINDYNSLTKENSASFIVANDGLYRSIGRSTKYFRSDAFLLTAFDMRHRDFKAPDKVNQQIFALARLDKAGIAQIYSLKEADNRTIDTIESQKEQIINSAWYVQGAEAESDFVGKVDKLDKEAVKFMVENGVMLGRISDETIIKTLALHLSLKYNHLFNNGCPSSIEMHKVDTHDIVRAFIVNSRKATVLSSYSYSNFVYRVAGIIGVYIAFTLELLTLAMSWIKIIMLIEIIFVFTATLVFHRIIAKSDTHDLMKGYVKTIAIVSISNFLFAMFINLTSNLTFIGVPPVINILYMVVVCLLYTFTMLFVMFTIIRNYKDLGNSVYNGLFNEAILKVDVNKSNGVQKVKIVNDENKAIRTNSGWDYFNELKNRKEDK